MPGREDVFSVTEPPLPIYHGFETQQKLTDQMLNPLRVGLMGNPSDGFYGKTIAMTISNFWAEVTLLESQTLVTQTHNSVHMP